MDGEVKAEIKAEIKTEPVDIITPLKDEAVNDDDEYVVPPKRFRRNQGSILCCAIFREIEV